MIILLLVCLSVPLPEISFSLRFVSYERKVGSWLPGSKVATACFSCIPPDLNLSKLSSLAVKATKIIFAKYMSTLIRKIKISHSPSQATPYNHHN